MRGGDAETDVIGAVALIVGVVVGVVVAIGGIGIGKIDGWSNDDESVTVAGGIVLRPLVSAVVVVVVVVLVVSLGVKEDIRFNGCLGNDNIPGTLGTGE